MHAKPDDQEDILKMPRGSLWVLLAVCIGVATWVVGAYAPETWGWPRIAVGGVLMGVIAHGSLFMNRILVADWS